jgi:hypothetical protein
MSRSRLMLFALAVAAPALLSPVQTDASDRSAPMQFRLQQQGPAEICGSHCRIWISAEGAITADTPRAFDIFRQGHDLRGLTVSLDSDGGSVHGAIALGREIRRLGLNTTVGRTIVLPTDDRGEPRAKLSPDADCESMCAFVLLAGLHRSVPPQARVMVHQIWLGDRRDDPTAANYSAEDLVLVQRDIGRLARFTADMGASIDLLDMALRIPPWEPMHLLTADELLHMRVATDAPADAKSATVASSPPVAAPTPIPPASNAARATTISESRWAMIDRAGAGMLARRQPLTIEADEIGDFDLFVACGAGDSYDMSYVERRHESDLHALPAALTDVVVTVGNHSTPLKVVSSKRRGDPAELVTYATGTVPAAFIGGFASNGNHSMMVQTRSADIATGIRLGNTGALQGLPRLAASCRNEMGDRAALVPIKTGGVAASK